MKVHLACTGTPCVCLHGLARPVLIVRAAVGAFLLDKLEDDSALTSEMSQLRPSQPLKSGGDKTAWEHLNLFTGFTRC